MSCGVGRRRNSDPTLLWLWHRPAATALIRPLAREPPFATGVALEEAKKTQKNQQTKKTKTTHTHTHTKYYLFIYYVYVYLAAPMACRSSWAPEPQQ